MLGPGCGVQLELGGYTVLLPEQHRIEEVTDGLWRWELMLYARGLKVVEMAELVRFWTVYRNSSHKYEMTPLAPMFQCRASCHACLTAATLLLALWFMSGRGETT